MRSTPDPYKEFKDDALRLRALNHRETCRVVTRVAVALFASPALGVLAWAAGHRLGWL